MHPPLKNALSLVGAATLGGLAVAGMTGSRLQQPPAEVQARAFTLVDADGKTLGALRSLGGRPALILANSADVPMVVLCVPDDETGLVAVGDPRGEDRRAFLSASPVGPILRFQMKDSGTVTVGVQESGPNVEAADGAGRVRFRAIKAR